MNFQAIQKTELNKILEAASEYAVLEKTKEKLRSFEPISTLLEVKKNLALTGEGIHLLFDYGVNKIEYFSPFSDEIERSMKGSTLTCGELIEVCALLRSARITHNSIGGVNAPEITKIRLFSERLYFDADLEDDINTKILNENEVSDFASDKLYSIRKEIRTLNERIRTRLSEYLTGEEAKYLQDGIITMRDNRYVLPVRAEYKRSIKGFVHDRSASGATFFVEPEEVLEMNNELITLAIDEKEEVERILSELSHRVGFLGNRLIDDISLLENIDEVFAKAEYAYKTTSVCPEMNDKGKIIINRGRHPLIDKDKVVPVSLSLGEKYRFLLISGPNTGGKTVSLKMVGLFALMAMCGLFIPAKEATLSVFDELYCDVGDAQSIEENLSTFSSHITNIIRIVDHATEKSLVLIDELGGGTDPDEGQALARAVVSHLLSIGACGVITTHYTALKEYAFHTEGIENACMEFNSDTLKPLYVIHIGLPGASNALAICRRLGLKESILEEALHNLSLGAQTFEHIITTAEDTRRKAEEEFKETNRLKEEWNEKVEQLNKEREKLEKDKEKFFTSAKAESRRIINEKAGEAEELLQEIEEIFSEKEITEADLIKARTLKNKLLNKSYESGAEELPMPQYKKADKSLKVGATVFIQDAGQTGIVQKVRAEKNEAEILCGSMRLRCKISSLSVLISEETAQTLKRNKSERKNDFIKVSKTLAPRKAPSLELNVIGQTVSEAIPEVEAFIDGAVLSNLEEVRIVHGMGTGKLRAGIHDYLKTNPHVAEFRLGRYGEGESGVSIVKIK